jgi:hypothetical protein
VLYQMSVFCVIWKSMMAATAWQNFIIGHPIKIESISPFWCSHILNTCTLWWQNKSFDKFNGKFKTCIWIPNLVKILEVSQIYYLLEKYLATILFCNIENNNWHRTIGFQNVSSLDLYAFFPLNSAEKFVSDIF